MRCNFAVAWCAVAVFSGNAFSSKERNLCLVVEQESVGVENFSGSSSNSLTSV